MNIYVAAMPGFTFNIYESITQIKVKLSKLIEYTIQIQIGIQIQISYEDAAHIKLRSSVGSL